MKQFFISGVSIILLLICTSVFAQNNPDKKTDMSIKLSGYVNSQYTYSDDGTNTFHIRRARLDIKGDLGKMVDYRFQTDFASSPKLVDAYVRVKFNPYLNLQFGQFKIPFSLENMMGPLTWESIENSQIINKLSGYSDVSGEGGNGRDLGLSLYGGFFKREGFNIIDYSLGVFNGNGINLKDNNTQKNIVGKLEIHPIKAVTISASYYKGLMNGVVDRTQRMPKDRAAFSLRYDDKKFLLRTEYLHGTTDMGEANPVVTDGCYAIIGYNIKGKVMPLLRYDFYRNDITAENGKSTYYMVGVDYHPWKYLRLQLNYTLKDVQAKNDLVNQVTAMVSFIFPSK